jgi:hypothetical protein
MNQPTSGQTDDAPARTAAERRLKTDLGQATLYNGGGPAVRPLLIRAFVAGWVTCDRVMQGRPPASSDETEEFDE